jgi:hypothetical protein
MTCITFRAMPGLRLTKIVSTEPAPVGVLRRVIPSD